MERPSRLVVLSNIPTPYNDRFFSVLSARSDVDLTVIYCAESERNRHWPMQHRKGYSYHILRNFSAGRLYFNPRIVRLLPKLNPDVLIVSGSYVTPTFWMATRWARKTGTPWVYWGESLKEAPRGGFAQLLRTRARLLLSKADLTLAIGTRAVESYVANGAQRSRVIPVEYYADVDQFSLSAAQQASVREPGRRNLGLEGFTFLFVGQLIERKGVDLLIQALVSTSNASCVIVGAGPEREALEELAVRLKLSDRVRFLGSVDPQELPNIFALADALVVPSRYEGWGVVVAEGMAAGLPVVASDMTNAAHDLIESDVTGLIFENNDPISLSECLGQLAKSPEEAQRMGARGSIAIRGHAPQVGSDRFMQALSQVRPKNVQSAPPT